jgi:hypothetical protein
MMLEIERKWLLFPPFFPDSFDRRSRQPSPPTHGQTHKHARILFFKIHKVVVHSPPPCIYTHFLSFYCQPFGIAAVAHLAAMIIPFYFFETNVIELQLKEMKRNGRNKLSNRKGYEQIMMCQVTKKGYIISHDPSFNPDEKRFTYN